MALDVELLQWALVMVGQTRKDDQRRVRVPMFLNTLVKSSETLCLSLITRSRKWFIDPRDTVVAFLFDWFEICVLKAGGDYAYYLLYP